MHPIKKNCLNQLKNSDSQPHHVTIFIRPLGLIRKSEVSPEAIRDRFFNCYYSPAQGNPRERRPHFFYQLKNWLLPYKISYNLIRAYQR